MSKQPKRRQYRQPAGGRPGTPFTPVPVRPRHDGWTPLKQDAFVKALAACANIEEACAAVGMSPRSYYDLRVRADAGSFRQAADAALDYGICRLADAMLGRALHGEVTPVFYKGEQIGERRRFDNRLGMFILRTRAIDRYGKWRDTVQATRAHSDGAALLFEQARRALAQDNLADAAGRPRRMRDTLRAEWNLADPAESADYDRRQEEREEERQRQADASHQARLDAIDDRAGGAVAAGNADGKENGKMTWREVPELPPPIDRAGSASDCPVGP